jgi:hypothetical protein
VLLAPLIVEVLQLLSGTVVACTVESKSRVTGDVDAVVPSEYESDPPKLVDICRSGESVQNV